MLTKYDWKPIEIAPKDGSPLLAIRDSKWSEPAEVIHWHCGHWRTNDGNPAVTANMEIWPTHWLPIPEKPGLGLLKEY